MNIVIMIIIIDHKHHNNLFYSLQDYKNSICFNTYEFIKKVNNIFISLNSEYGYFLNGTII